MKEENIHIDDLIITFLAEGLDEKSLKKLKDWIYTTPDNYQYFMQQQELWFSAVDTQKRKYNKEEAFEKFKTQIREKGKKREKLHINKIVYWAASVALVIIIAYTSYWQGKVQVKNSFSNITVEAPLGSKTKLYLPDGTLVWLNAGSIITYSQGFGVDNRNMNLSGEAYFEVVKNQDLPFSINTQEMELEVLGTKFDFKNYLEDEEAIVNLVEGKVAINNLLKKNDIDYLLTNEKITLNKKTGIMVKSVAKAGNSMRWTNDILSFDEELLPDIVKELKRNYNVEIVIDKDSLYKERFYGDFSTRNQTIQEVLNMLASTGRLKYKIKENTIVLY